MKTRSERDLGHRRAGLQRHVGEGALGRFAVGRGLHRRRVGDRVGHLDHHAGVGAPGDHRRDRSRRRPRPRCRSSAPVVGRQLAPALDRRVEVLGRRGAAAHPLEGRLVGGDHPGPAAALDRHVADRHPARHRERLDRRPGVLDRVAGHAAGAEAADRRQDQVLGGDAGAQLARVGDPHRLRPLLDQALGRQHVLDLGGADAEGQRAEGAVGGGVAVAADDRHPRLGHAQLRARSRGRSPGGRSPASRSGCRTPRSCAPASRPGRGRARRRSAAPPSCRRWARCGRRWRSSCRGGARRARPAAARRRPAAR